jgi:hypothetical protein
MKGNLSASEHIETMLNWFISHQVDRWDLAVLRPSGAFLVKSSRDLSPEALHRLLPWARGANAHSSEIYLRPARGHSWPVIFLDDVCEKMALPICEKYAAMAIRTSREGGCHVWLHITRPLDEAERSIAQRYLQTLVGSDPASVSGEHWGRLAGMKNHKRKGQWVGILAKSSRLPWNPAPAFSPPICGGRVALSRETSLPVSRCRDESAAEFAWCCHNLRNGSSPEEITLRLTMRAEKRGKRKPADYARRTVYAAMRRLS